LQRVAVVAAIRWRHSEIRLGESALGLVAKSKERRQLRLNLILRLSVDKITVSAGYRLIRIRLNILKNRLAAYRVSVGSTQRDRRADVFRTFNRRIVGDTGRSIVSVLGAQPEPAISQQVTPSLRSLLLERSSDEELLVSLNGCIRDSIELDSIGKSYRRR
jgi:hypothetical protein